MKKQIKGFEDYSVDTEGRVWSMKSGKVKERKPLKHKDGYLQINLRKDGKVKNLLIHRLVAIAFIPNPKNYTQVNHKNGIKTDNRLENLEWCSGSQNMKHAFDLGLQCNKGSKNSKAKLKDEDIPVIHKRLANGEHIKDIAEDYSVNNSTIKHIKYKRTWTHI